MNYLWNTIKEYKMKAARPSPDVCALQGWKSHAPKQCMKSTVILQFAMFWCCADITGHMDPKKQLSGKSFWNAFTRRCYACEILFSRGFWPQIIWDIDSMRNWTARTSLKPFVMWRYISRIPAMLYPFNFEETASHSTMCLSNKLPFFDDSVIILNCLKTVTREAR